MMFKIFTLAVAVSVIPVSDNIINTDFASYKSSAASANIFAYKNIALNPFETS